MKKTRLTIETRETVLLLRCRCPALRRNAQLIRRVQITELLSHLSVDDSRRHRIYDRSQSYIQQFRVAACGDVLGYSRGRDADTVRPEF